MGTLRFVVFENDSDGARSVSDIIEIDSAKHGRATWSWWYSHCRHQLYKSEYSGSIEITFGDQKFEPWTKAQDARLMMQEIHDLESRAALYRQQLRDFIRG